VVYHDAAHDVVYYPMDGTGHRRVPRVQDPDITRAGVYHGDHYVWVRLTLRHLRRAGLDADRATRNWSARIVTAEHRYRLYGWVHPEDEGVPLMMMLGPGPDCLGLRVRFDYARDVVITRVPRACIGQPRWVRLGVVFQRQPSGAFYDDAFSTARPSPESYGTLSPRVFT
jgi:hypothetical protein